MIPFNTAMRGSAAVVAVLRSPNSASTKASAGEASNETVDSVRSSINETVEKLKAVPGYDDAFNITLSDALSTHPSAWAQNIARDPAYGSIKDVVKEETSRGAIQWYIDKGRELEGLKRVHENLIALLQSAKKANSGEDFEGKGYTNDSIHPVNVEFEPVEGSGGVIDMSLAKNMLHAAFPDGIGGLKRGMGMDDEVEAYRMAVGLYNNLPDTATAGELEVAIKSYAASNAAKDTLTLLIGDGVKRKGLGAGTYKRVSLSNSIQTKAANDVRKEREQLKAELASLEAQMAVYLKELGYE